jgi:RHS repeat-associated protein
VNLPASVSYTYDLNGNLTSDGYRAFAYDDADQLTAVQVANVWRSEFVYDAFGRRRIRREKVWKNSQWLVAAEVRYVYDGMLVIQEPPTPRGIGASTPGHVSVGWRCAGLCVAGYGGPRRDGNNIPTVSYTRGRDLGGGRQGAGGIGGLLALTQPSAVSPQHFYYHSDSDGNVTSLLDSHQTVAARYQYDPFGNLLGLSGTMADGNLYRFSSKELHQNSGLYYYGYRFYEPGLQRWINADPIEEDGGLNLYGFVYNAPTDLLDLYGLDWWDDWRDWSEGASEAFYGSLAGLDPLGLVLIDPDNPNMQGGQYVGLAGGMCLGGTGEIKAGLAAAKGVAKKALAKCKRIRNPRLHHPWPQYLGGPFKQVLEKVPKSLHDKYHSGLDKLLPRKWGTGQLQRPVPTTAGRELRHALQVYRGVRQAVRHPPH